ncbi:hypothetical protein ACFC26_07970 [Kitasatospora purpeofusca]|uniref:hypothetical protein n=1 Tax=Kitasatospora purpeofusca TaxID=67352 RepID=UPI0035DD66F4
MDVELILTTWLRGRFPDVRSCTELPARVETVLPVVQVATVGGPAARFGSRPRIDVDVFAADYGSARSLALRVRDELLALRGPVEPGAVVKWTRIDSDPSRRPYENPALRRVGLTVTIALHPAAY